jgi:hypothetical protein
MAEIAGFLAASLQGAVLLAWVRPVTAFQLWLVHGFPSLQRQHVRCSTQRYDRGHVSDTVAADTGGSPDTTATDGSDVAATPVL